MNCPGCDRPLQRREIAQAVTVLDLRVRPASFCDDCCRKGQSQPGSPESLTRLVAGGVDPAEQLRVREMTRLPWEQALAAAKPPGMTFETPAGVQGALDAS